MRLLVLITFTLTCLEFVPIPSIARIAPDSAQAGVKSVLVEGDLFIELPKVIIEDVAVKVTLAFRNTDHPLLADNSNKLVFLVNGTPTPILFVDGVATLEHTFSGNPNIEFEFGEYHNTVTASPIPLLLSILPPLIAIIMALLFKEVITSLFLGIFIGSAVIGFYSEGFKGVFTGLLSVLDTYVINSISNWGHLAVIIFSMLIGGIVSVISRNGGMQGVVNIISKYARDARSGQFAVWLLGVVIFFDDYANTLVVGNTMRPVTDKLRISREKLSYIVDSTAAPVAAIAFVTTWIGFELGYIENGLKTIGMEQNAYSVFFSSLEYAFYPVFTLVFILLLIFQGKDFGAMLRAETRARTTGKVFNDRSTTGKSLFSRRRKTASNTDEALEIEEEQAEDELSMLQPAPTAKFRWINAFLPILVVVAGTILGLVFTGLHAVKWPDEEIGLGRKLSMIIGASNSYSALLWASLSGLLVAVALTLSQGILSLSATVDAVMKGFKTMLGAVMILVLAWSLALVTEELHTADYITATLLTGGMSPVLIPALTFLVASLIAFSTGSSWGSMAILYPLMLPAAWQVCMVSGMDEQSAMLIFSNVVSCVLAGSVLGDHCSPISDTTILSSLASSCNHIDHVRTQLPYAFTVGIVAVIFGTIPGAMGASPLITFPLGIAVLWVIVRFIGKTVDNPGEETYKSTAA